MKTWSLIFLLLAAGCSGGAQSFKDDGVPRCMDLCANNFSLCTERNPGDYTACSGERSQCDQECRSQEAESDAKKQSGEVISPTDVPSQPSEPEAEPAPDPLPQDVPAAE